MENGMEALGSAGVPAGIFEPSVGESRHLERSAEPIKVRGLRVCSPRVTVALGGLCGRRMPAGTPAVLYFPVGSPKFSTKNCVARRKSTTRAGGSLMPCPRPGKTATSAYFSDAINSSITSSVFAKCTLSSPVPAAISNLPCNPRRFSPARILHIPLRAPTAARGIARCKSCRRASNPKPANRQSRL